MLTAIDDARAGANATLLLDAYYTIGRLHLFCEDYALHGWEPVPHLILADGCSAAPDSDLGARLLALNARRFLPRFVHAASGSERLARHWPLGQRIVRRAARQARDLGLDPTTVLDATLLIAWCDGGMVHVHLYGDGCLAVRRADGGVGTIRVEYAENAPYYLSYLLDPERWELYQEAIGEPATAQSIHYQIDAGDSIRQEAFNAPTVFAFDLATFPVVAVATDGLDSFVAAETGARLDLRTAARAVLDFQNLDGAFVQRQLRQVLVDYAQQRVVNMDDIGLGAFVRLAGAVETDAPSGADGMSIPGAFP
ncbi:MAG: protein phosphatase 2C domain-containing protein [Candidatus Contendobacter sp.]|nr:protein phosphatase 2C domain-containing protein [Candidatus Contendobacter sp.]MDG4557076.1 protein phosphatase 2C domain-containing protein [Candidatus Contendobacter sp.]